MKLIELTPDILKEIENGGELVFKGDVEEKAVLCSSSKTYEVKEAETSNSLLLVPDLIYGAGTADENTLNASNASADSENSLNGSLNKSDEGPPPEWTVYHKQIVKPFFTYLEFRQIKPKFQKLYNILSTTTFSGTENEYKIDKTQLANFDELFERVQSSRAELLEALNTLQAIEIDGKYRILDFEYEFRVLSYMLDLIEENSWSLDTIDKDVTLQSLDTLVPEVILEKVFEYYAEVAKEVDGKVFYKYDETKVCIFLARVLLKNAGRFNLQEFMQAWKDSVPEGMQVDETMLWGEALASDGVIWSFPERDLPEDIEERFKVLFQTKPKWSETEILPYIKRYTSERVNAAALLTRHARAERSQDGVRLFSARHAR